jgi:hypothetical protein
MSGHRCCIGAPCFLAIIADGSALGTTPAGPVGLHLPALKQMMGKVHDTIVTARKPDPEAVAASRKRDLCADDIANLIQPVALELLGTPNQRLSSQSELRFGSNGSLALTIAGDRIGQWYSFEDGAGGRRARPHRPRARRIAGHGSDMAENSPLL